VAAKREVIAMTVRRLEHYNIRTTKFDETVKFYDDALGMKAGVPPMAKAGGRASWIYDDSGVPAVHLTAVDPADPIASYSRMAQYRGGDIGAAFEGSGAIDHIAFECEEFDKIKARLESLNLDFVENGFANFSLRQIFLKDPNGITLELNFR
jgi:catechol 2,3-dioxygenase-like lactoylglutathione lyase family enzyme